MSIVQGIDGNMQLVSVLMALYKVQHNETRIIGLNVMKDTSDVFDDVLNNLQRSSMCVCIWLVFLFFFYIYTFPLCLTPSQNRSVFGLSDSWLGASSASALPCGG